VAEDPLNVVLQLVVEGRLSAAEAAPILAALDASAGSGEGPSAAAPGAAATSGADHPHGAMGPARTLLVEVSDGARTIVNLRLPLALGRYAIDRIPGLSGDQVARVREALSSGLTGPVLLVDDENGSVRIQIE
jgi:hypothetical protein